MYENNLERKTENYKSEGERNIAEFLVNKKIGFKYERPVLVLDENKPRIFYPDFFIPEFALYLEYFGINGNGDYNKRTIHKEEIYKKNRIDIIPIYPEHLKHNLSSYIGKSIKGTLDKRLIQYRLKFPNEY